MKVFLMHRDRDLDLEPDQLSNEDALTQDLELSTLFSAMAQGDSFLLELARTVMLASLTDPDEIRFRQQVLADCLQHPAAVRAIYSIAVEAIEGERRGYFSLYKGASAETILHRSVQLMEHFVGMLKRLRALGDEHGSDFRSPGFARLFGMLAEELDDVYFGAVDRHLAELNLRRGVLISAKLGDGLHGTAYTLHRIPSPTTWLSRISQRRRTPSYSFQLAERDEAGALALERLRGQGVNLAANALAQSADHVRSFFALLRAELAFYVCCLNLYERLAEKGEPVCFPEPLPSGGPVLAFQGLYDVCLSLHLGARAVGNDADVRDAGLVVVTGANQGGKSTFLRSVGLAHLMMQCGMFVPAERFRADVRDRVFTHYKREEDPGLESGKLDEELARMSSIVDEITPRSLLLCNESFASTNEREGSEIARQVIRALTGSGVKICLVTHLFDLAHGFYEERADGTFFLRAERLESGERTFRLVEGEPLPTSHGEDVYRRIFQPDRSDAADAAR